MGISDTETEQVAAEAIVDLASQNVIHSEVEAGGDPHSVSIETMAIDSVDQQAVVIEGGEGEHQGQIEISTQQLDQLSSGDYIEINGQTYRVCMHMYTSVSGAVLVFYFGNFVVESYLSFVVPFFYFKIDHLPNYFGQVSHRLSDGKLSACRLLWPIIANPRQKLGYKTLRIFHFGYLKT